MKYSRPHITLQPIFHGVETPEDMVFLNHYINHVSGVLTVENQHKNAFKDMLLQMAVEHRGLMHSILSMASHHIDWDAPYGKKILETNTKVTPASLEARSEFHHTAGMKILCEDIELDSKNDGNGSNVSVRYGQMLCILIQTVAQGCRQGQHRLHLKAYKNLMASQPPNDPAFLVFITEFFQYRVFVDELIHYPELPGTDGPRLALEDWTPWLPIEPPRLIGVADGLLHYLCQITTIRNAIRANINAGNDPVVDYTSLYRAAEIDAAIRDWQPHWPPGDSRDRVGLLYKQMVWVYLYRTIYPPSISSPAPPSLLSLSSSIESLSSASSLSRSSIPQPRPQSQHQRHQQRAQQQHAIQTPPTERPMSSHHHSEDDDDDNDDDIDDDDDDDEKGGRGGSTPSGSVRADSPPPIRYPPHHDHQITLAVDECLAIIESFKPGDSVQTLLLVPCLIIGCACFAPAQRQKVRAAIRAVRGYTGLRNCELVRELLDEVWRLMERGEWVRVWDWQGVAKSLGLDFSCA